MTDANRRDVLRDASLGFVLATVVGLLIGVVGFGDPWTETSVTAVGIGIGVAFGFALYHGLRDDSDRTE